MFEKSLYDLIRGIRSHKGAEDKYIQSALAECKREIKSTEISTKASAVLKLTYLQMIGTDISFACFQILEVMSSPLPTKKIGYLAASQSFDKNTAVLLLCTNLLKKDLSSSNTAEISAALTCLSGIITPSLALDLSLDIDRLTAHSKPLIRKKVVIAMFKMMSMIETDMLSRIRERLVDDDPAVVSCAVSTVSELARLEPRRYLPLAPLFYGLLTTSSNNWMLIKIIKIFGNLLPYESRLANKLLTPISSLIASTGAPSLRYECISLLVSSNMLQGNDSLARLCSDKIRGLFGDGDSNLSYVALLALNGLYATHPELVYSSSGLLMPCLDSEDPSIRSIALEVVEKLVTQESLPEVVRKLISHLLPGSAWSLSDEHRQETVQKIVEMCKANTYENVASFEWYTAVLIDIANHAHVDITIVGKELLNIAIRVPDIRRDAVAQMIGLLEFGMPEVVFCIGEFARLLDDGSSVLLRLLKLGEDESILPASIIAIPKIFLVLSPSEQRDILQEILSFLSNKTLHPDLDLQERAVQMFELFKLVEEALEGKNDNFLSIGMTSLFRGELNPVAPSAQGKVQVPFGLNLDVPLHSPVEVSDSEEEPALDNTNPEIISTFELESRSDDPFYIGKQRTLDVDTIPITPFQLANRPANDTALGIAAKRPTLLAEESPGELPKQQPTPPEPTPPVRQMPIAPAGETNHAGVPVKKLRRKKKAPNAN